MRVSIGFFFALFFSIRNHDRTLASVYSGDFFAYFAYFAHFMRILLLILVPLPLPVANQIVNNKVWRVAKVFSHFGGGRRAPISRAERLSRASSGRLFCSSLAECRSQKDELARKLIEKWRAKEKREIKEEVNKSDDNGQ